MDGHGLISPYVKLFYEYLKNFPLKGHLCRFENLPIYLSTHENNMLKILHENTFNILQ